MKENRILTLCGKFRDEAYGVHFRQKPLCSMPRPIHLQGNYRSPGRKNIDIKHNNWIALVPDTYFYTLPRYSSSTIFLYAIFVEASFPT
jgi:hypothetical protein